MSPMTSLALVQGPPEVDDVLREYFRPDALDARGARRAGARAVRLGAGGGPTAAALLDRLAVEVTRRGVSRVARGAQRPGGDGAARRLIERAREELWQYLAGQRAFFSVPVDLAGVAPFQAKVLAAAERIPFGEARPYAWVAGRAGHPRAVRAVGTALGTNPVPILVPCHRVLRSDGAVGGYIFGSALKRRLLEIERTTPTLVGCATTRIVCRVGCAAARRMRPTSRVVFASVGDARSVGYRPCRRCRPEDAA
jgi:O-6-methylguanine DNA methyltransferase